MTTLNAFTLRETRVAVRLGVNRDTLRELRRSGALEEGVDWGSGPGGSVCYAEGSVNKIMQHLLPDNPQSTTEKAASDQDDAGASDTPGPLSSEAPHENAGGTGTQAAAAALEKAASAVIALVCSSQPASPGAPHYRNPRVIQATTPAGETVTVRTHDSRLYRRGMALAAYNDGNGWIVSGRPPRRAGRSAL